MKKFLDILSEEMGKAFATAGYGAELGRVTVSNRPDLCEYQCNGAMAGAKQYKKPPFVIAGDVQKALEGSKVFDKVDVVAPGFLNLNVSRELLKDYLNEMYRCAVKFGCEIDAPTPYINVWNDNKGSIVLLIDAQM